MNFYYCQSEWEHAVIEAKNVPLAKRVFVNIINSHLEANKKISVYDVSAVIVNVYREGSEAAEHGVQRTVDQPCEKHNMEFCSECFPVVVVDFNRR